MKKKIIILTTILVLIIGLISTFLIIKNINEKKQKELELKQLEVVKSHYSEYVVTTKKTDLYKLKNDKYIKYGKINKDINLKLKETKIKHDTKYFYIEDLDLYIKYEDVKTSKEFIKNDRYKNYIFFNLNVKTKDKTNFYDIDNNFIYSFNESYEFKVLIKEDNRYGVIFNDELLFINVDDVKEEVESKNTDLKNKSRIKTLTYHFIYNPETTKCDQIICQSLDQFESHLKYINENNYFSLNLHELEYYLKGYLKIPEKSIVLTVDDGTIFDLKSIELLEKYDVTATLFLVTSWIKPDRLKSDKLYLESHSHNMHNQYECKGYGSQGGGILCLDREYVLNDLKTSQEILGGSTYFAYPFFDFSDRAISLLKEAGFKMAFIGQYDTDGYSYPNKTDLFKVRRKTIFSDTSMNEFISYLK